MKAPLSWSTVVSTVIHMCGWAFAADASAPQSRARTPCRGAAAFASCACWTSSDGHRAAPLVRKYGQRADSGNSPTGSTIPTFPAITIYYNIASLGGRRRSRRDAAGGCASDAGRGTAGALVRAAGGRGAQGGRDHQAAACPGGAGDGGRRRARAAGQGRGLPPHTYALQALGGPRAARRRPVLSHVRDGRAVHDQDREIAARHGGGGDAAGRPTPASC